MEGIGRPVEEGKVYELTVDAKGAKGAKTYPKQI